MRAGYRIDNGVRVQFDLLDLFSANTNQIEYYYRSRLPGEPIDDVKTCRSASAVKRAVKKVGNVRKEAGKRLGR
jgi:hypothetical protein